MTSTLTYGRTLPATNDLGNVWFPALEANIALDDAHDHDGTDSSKLPTTSLTKSTTSILAAAWVDQGGGTYRQEVTLPSGFTFATTTISVRLAGASDDIIYPTITEGSAANKYYIYINDNTLALTALYV
jgi:hypothetical protein